MADADNGGDGDEYVMSSLLMIRYMYTRDRSLAA